MVDAIHVNQHCCIKLISKLQCMYNVLLMLKQGNYSILMLNVTHTCSVPLVSISFQV